MRLVCGGVDDPTCDRVVTDSLADLAAEAAEPVLRVWTPPRQVAFGRRDTIADGYDRAREIASERGYEPIEREVGGNAVAYTGRTVSFAYATPTAAGRDGIDRRYRSTVETLLEALAETGATVTPGEPDRSFCPGAHSIRSSDPGGGKISGIAQRVGQGAVLVGGCVVVRSADARAIADILAPIYSVLEPPFDSESVGSVASAGGPNAVAPVVEAIEAAFGTERETTAVPASTLLSGHAP